MFTKAPNGLVLESDNKCSQLFLKASVAAQDMFVKAQSEYLAMP